MANYAYYDYTVSKDGKTVTVNGKKYSRSQFLKTFSPETSGSLKGAKYGTEAVTPGAKGTAKPHPKGTKVTGTTLKEERQAKAAEKKAAKPTAAGKTKIGTMSVGRGGMGGIGAFSTKQIR